MSTQPKSKSSPKTSPKIGLGKGFESLLPQDFDTSILAKSGEQVRQIALSKLLPNPNQPRKTFDQIALVELSISIERHGILQPLVLSPYGEKYYVIAGERRWRAAEIAGLKTVPALVRTTRELERVELALVENIQRVSLPPLELAASIVYLQEQFNVDIGTIADQLGKAETTLINITRLLKLEPASRQALQEKRISEGHARQLLAIKEPNAQNTFLQLILKHGWSVRQAERYVNAQKKQGISSVKKAVNHVLSTNSQTEKLGKYLGTSVTIRRMANGGRLEIAYQNEEDLERIIRSVAGK